MVDRQTASILPVRKFDFNLKRLELVMAELDDDYRTSASIENCFSNVPLSFSAVFYAIIIKLIFVFIHTNNLLLAFTEGILSSLSYPIIYRIINLILRLMAEITAYNLNQEMLTRLTLMNPEFLSQSFESPFGCQVNYSHFG